MRMFEYEITASTDTQVHVEELNERGAEGWELVQIIPAVYDWTGTWDKVHYVWKRERKEPKP